MSFATTSAQGDVLNATLEMKIMGCEIDALRGEIEAGLIKK